MKGLGMAKPVLCVGISLVLLVGCVGFQETKRLVLLDEIALSYEQALLSGNYRVANRFTKKEGGGQQTADFDHLKNIQVSSYELIDKFFSPGGLKARLTVEIRYFHASHLIEKSLVDEQEWEYDEKDKCWYLASGLPDFR
jgi:hypothetical protein